MCCRYWAAESPEYRRIVEEMNKSSLIRRWQTTSGITTFGEVRPTNVVPVIASNRAGKRAVFPMKWGFSGKTLLMNARSETAASRPTFREAWAAHRCIVPASWYFEWQRFTDAAGRQRTGDKYLIQPRGSEMTWLCGLYRLEDNLPVFVILTRESCDDLRFLHDRMPLMLPGDRIGEWIRPDTRPEALLPAAVTDVVCERVEANASR